jgi:protein SCO1/2
LKNRTLGLLLVSVVIVVPVLILLIISRGTNEYKELPYLGIPKGIDANGDTIRHKAPAFSLISKKNEAFNSELLANKTYVVAFFFTRCNSICPKITQNLKVVQEKFKEAPNFELIEISIDPKHDSASALMAYAKKHEVDLSNYTFLTGDSKEEIYKIMNQDGYLELEPQPDPNDPIQLQHTPMITLVDRDGYLRGKYDGTNPKQVERLMDEIRLLYLKYAKVDKESK